MKELLKVTGVKELKRDFYELVIRDTKTNETDSIILCNPNIKDYCKQNNISLKSYEFSLPAYGWADLIGVIDSYVVEDNYRFKMNEAD